tara:strand:+ start:149 stop:1144 length:996 start_codon:yes stop_codon:yes gene_type:complete
MAFAVDIQAGSPYGNINAEQGTITVVGKILWTNLGNKLNELFPSSTSAGVGANPVDPLFGIYRCQSCEFRPIGENPNVVYGSPAASVFDADFTMPAYEFAWLTITYSSLQVEFPNVTGDNPDTPDGTTEVTGLTHQLSSGGEVITLANDSLYWSDGVCAKGTNVTASKVIVTVEHNVTWRRVLTPPWADMRSLVGKVNNADLGPLQTGTMIEETLLYLGFTAVPDIMSDGTRVWEIGYRFSERRVDELTKLIRGIGGVVLDGVTGHEGEFGGWNHFYKQEESKDKDGNVNTKTSGFRRLHSVEPAGGGNPLVYAEKTAIFRKADLSALFVQ